jgi:AbrB family transcriptional regulator (stage V sporulation protein T)
MKATGVVRRIDELGRIVIPKEIRRTLKIKEGTPLEIYSGERGELVLKKYSPILEIADFAGEIAESINMALELNVLVTNMECVVNARGDCKSAYINKNIDSAIERAINSRQAKIYGTNTYSTLFFDGNQNVSFALCPILSAGDLFGSIIIFSSQKPICEPDLKTAKAFADFLGKQVG